MAEPGLAGVPITPGVHLCPQVSGLQPIEPKFSCWVCRILPPWLLGCSSHPSLLLLCHGGGESVRFAWESMGSSGIPTPGVSRGPFLAPVRAAPSGSIRSKICLWGVNPEQSPFFSCWEAGMRLETH